MNASQIVTSLSAITCKVKSFVSALVRFPCRLQWPAWDEPYSRPPHSTLFVFFDSTSTALQQRQPSVANSIMAFNSLPIEVFSSNPLSHPACQELCIHARECQHAKIYNSSISISLPTCLTTVIFVTSPSSAIRPMSPSTRRVPASGDSGSVRSSIFYQGSKAMSLRHSIKADVRSSARALTSCSAVSPKREAAWK